MHQGNPRKARLAGLLCALIGFCVVATSTRAAVLALYPFTGNSLANTATPTQSTASAITLGSGLTDTTRYTTTGNPGAALRINTDETDGTSTATAITANDFFTFNLAPNNGYRFVFTSFTVDLATNVTTFSTNVVLQASINGGTSFINVDTLTGFSNTTFTTRTTDLTTFNNNAALAAGASVLLRIVVYDNDNNAANYTAFDNITVNGSLQAIPEPGTVALVGLGLTLAGTVILRRRKR